VVSRGRISELDTYLDEHRLDHTIDLDILSWWKVNQNRFPSLSNMARDILSIPITTVASESCFSMGGRILTKWRASLKPENAEALVTTRSWVFGFKMDDGKFYEIFVVQNFICMFFLIITTKYVDFSCTYLSMQMRMIKNSMVFVLNFLKSH